MLNTPTSGRNCARRRPPIPENDIWIAALCRQHQMAVASRDGHFDKVRGLKRVGW